MSAFPGEYRHFTGVIVSAASLQLRNQRFSRLCRSVRLAHGCCCRDSERHRRPSTGLPDHQHFIFPALGALFQIDAQRNIARIAVRDGGGAGDHGAVCRVLLLENGLACSNLLLADPGGRH